MSMFTKWRKDISDGKEAVAPDKEDSSEPQLTPKPEPRPSENSTPDSSQAPSTVDKEDSQPGDDKEDSPVDTKNEGSQADAKNEDSQTDAKNEDSQSDTRTGGSSSDAKDKDLPTGGPQESTPPQTPPESNVDENELVDAVQGLQVGGEVVDAPDLSLKSGGLREPGHEIEKKTADGSMYRSARTFEELGLRDDLLQGLYSEMRFEKPSMIQAETLPMILEPPYKSLIAQAHNGSGKTTCFVLAMLTRINPDLNAPQAMCVCPTRELVAQNLAVLRRMGKFTKIRSCSTATTREDGIGDHGKITHQIIIGTHGTLKKWLTRRMLALNNIVVLVLDEADNMLSTGAFASDSYRMIRDIRSRSRNLQLLLFSATFNDEVTTFAKKILQNESPNEVFVPKEELSLDVIKQYRVVVPNVESKYRVLKDMVFPNCEKLGQTIIFVRTREGARQLHRRLTSDGNTCTSICGDMEFSERDRVIEEFRNNVTRILVSTDVLSRGFDVSDVTLVVNYDIPVEGNQTPAFETYLHRIGRSGRFGRKGAAFNLISSQRESAFVDEIARYFNHEIPEVDCNDEENFVEVLKKAGLTDG